jgi:aqualysin 1
MLPRCLPRPLPAFVALLALTPAGACTDRSTPVEIAGPEQVVGRSPDDTAGSYIVVLRPSPAARSSSQALQQQFAERVHFDYQTVLAGFAADLRAPAVRALRRRPEVEYVVPDGPVVPAGLDATAGWGVGRIDQRYGPSDSRFEYGTTGSGVNIYIVDTGINVAHPDFGGRAAGAWSWDPAVYPAGQDCNGHGTAVASVAAGSEYGVAKGARIWSVRARDCNAHGTKSRYIAAMEWVARNHLRPAVMNLSFEVWDGTGLNTHYPIRDAAIGAKNAGVFVVAAAGNRGTDACSSAPANALPIMTVGATDPADSRPAFSNYGSCVDLFAPGTSISAANHTGGYGQWTGTSFAAPIVAGIGALLLERYPTDSPDQIHYAIRDGATAGVVRNPGPSSPNLLAYSQLPVPVYTSIIGPSQVGPFMHCTWIADVRGGRAPFQYTWSGILSGFSNLMSGQVSRPGSLNLTVRDVLGGTASSSRFVGIDPANYSTWCA